MSVSASSGTLRSAPQLKIMLCAPRGFCAGVVRAIDAVEKALEIYGVPETSAPVIFSAHGVPKSVPEEARGRNFFTIDATCPLVTKVHREAEIHWRRGRTLAFIGHAGHPEVVGTMGQLPDGAVILVENIEDVARLIPPESGKLAWASQTTLSVDDTREIVAALVARFPDIVGPHKDDICYATTNRQDAVKAVAPQVEAMIVVGAPNSSNSLRLREVAELAGCCVSVLIQRASDLDFALLNGVTRLGITAGASAPEVLVDEIIDALRARFDVTIETVTNAVENVHFPAPRELRVRGQSS